MISSNSQRGTSKQLRDLTFEYNALDSVTRRYDAVTEVEQTYSYDVKDQLTGMVEISPQVGYLELHLRQLR